LNLLSQNYDLNSAWALTKTPSYKLELNEIAGRSGG